MPLISDMRRRLEQSAAAEAVMQEYVAFARNIGCEVEGDAISCTASQVKVLNTWWKNRTFGMRYGQEGKVKGPKQ